MLVPFPNNALLLAPMVEITHRPLRELIDSFGGCDLFYTEMSSAQAFVAGAPWDSYFLDTLPRPDRTVLQFYATDRERMVQAAVQARVINAAGLDLNFGCSAPHIERAGGGVRWMKDPAAARDLVAAVRDVWPDRSLSVKTRAGYEDDYGYLRDFCGGLVEAGVDYIVVHPRLKSEKFRRTGKWDYIKSLALDLGVPIVGNGDVRSFSDWNDRVTRYKPAGVMIGRGAVRKPWLFALIRGIQADSNFSMRIDLYRTAHTMVDLIGSHLPKEFHRSRLRRFFFYFCDNLTFAHHLRVQFQQANTLDDARNLIDTYFREVSRDCVLEEHI